MKHWTMNEIRFVRDNIELTDAELADELERTRASVQYMRIAHDIRKRARVGCEEVQLVANNPTLDRHDFARMTGRNPNSFYYVRGLAQ